MRLDTARTVRPSGDHSARGRVGCAALLTAVVLAASPALAQRDDPVLQLGCAPDFFRLCPGVDPQSGDAERCMNRNRPRLSPDCRNAIADYDKRSGTKGARKPAEPD